LLCFQNNLFQRDCGRGQRVGSGPYHVGRSWGGGAERRYVLGNGGEIKILRHSAGLCAQICTAEQPKKVCTGRRNHATLAESPPLIKVHSGPLVGHFFYALGGGLLLGQWTTSINMGMDLYRGGLIRHHMTRKET